MDAMRWLRHWFHAPASRAFPADTMHAIQAAIAAGESRHDAEVCFAVEPRLPARYLLGGRSVRSRAESVFSDLRVWNTERRNGVLIYVLLADYVIEVVPDRGVAGKVPDPAWSHVTAVMCAKFRADAWKDGALAGIEAAHALLAEYLPPVAGKRDELSNAPVLL